MASIKKGFTFFICTIFCIHLNAQEKLNIFITEGKPPKEAKTFHSPPNNLIQYTGRIEQQNDSLPRLWQPGIYITAKFKGNLCEVFLNDEVKYGNSHNYIEVIIDNFKPVRLQAKWQQNIIKAEGLSGTRHTITICKNTEGGIGYLEFAGINCTELLQLPVKPERKIEFIGNSITCGSGMDVMKIPCGKGQWYDQHDAYMSYGPLTARALNCQWHISAVSGIGLIHSCCDMNIAMPQVFDKINMRDDSIQWNFNEYIPDVVTICLGQNDGAMDSATFCNAYINFIRSIREKYAKPEIVCLSSPMADAALTAVLKNYISSIVTELNNNGDKNVYKYFFLKSYNTGCGGHPGFNDHKQIADELTDYIKNLKHW